jgi:hypothetical protein
MGYCAGVEESGGSVLRSSCHLKYLMSMGTHMCLNCLVYHPVVIDNHFQGLSGTWEARGTRAADTDEASP